MTNRIGINIAASVATEAVERIVRAEAAGATAVWMTAGGARIDSLTVFAAAAMRTSRVLFGTSIVPTYPRHPLVMAAQARVVAELAPGRLRLGIGPSHRPTIEGMGFAFTAPHEHLRDYIRVVKPLLQAGRVDHTGKHLSAKESIAGPLDVPVMAGALRRRAFELCGEEADGAITWVCPLPYVKSVGVPAIQAGAERAKRPVPPIVAHIPVAVHENGDDVRKAVRDQVPNPRMPFYQQMFADAGFPEALELKGWSDRMIDATVFWGGEREVEERLRAAFDCGATELLCAPVLCGTDPAASWDRTVTLLGKVSASL